MQREIWAGDNLEFLEGLEAGSVELVYMDPPFASSREYSANLSRIRVGDIGSTVAFADVRWKEYKSHLGAEGRQKIDAANSLIKVIADSGQPEMAGYLSMMLPRVAGSRRALSLTGSLYLHCDSSASHYLKLLLDIVFGADNFRSQIVWKRTHAHNGARRFGPVHDVILFYSRTSGYQWNQQRTAYEKSYVEKYYRSFDDNGPYQLITCTGPGDRQGTRAHYEWRGVFPPPGRHWAWKVERMRELEREGRLVYSSNGIPRFKRYLTEGSGVALQDVWTDINRLDAHSEERVGYETQKPVALLERIISSSSSQGDLVVDPFSGSGTTAVAAERLGRNWKTSDVSLLAASITLARTRQEAGTENITLHGFPASRSEANALQRGAPQTFGVWGNSLMATQVLKDGFSESVVAGFGRIPTARKAADFMSWVALNGSGDLVLPSTRSKRLPTMGFVLGNEVDSRALASQVALAFPKLPLVHVEVESLVSSSALRRGATPFVAEAVESLI